MMKKIKKMCFLCLTMLMLLGVMPVYAETVGNVYDDAGLLTSEEISYLDSEIEALKDVTGWEIFAVSTSDTNGKSAMVYADDFFDTHTAEDADGVVLLIDMDNREMYISTCGEAIRYLTDGRLDHILDDAYYYASDSDFYNCFLAMAGGVENYYNAGIVNGQYNYDTETGQVSRYHSITLTEAMGALIAAIGVGLAIYLIVVGKYRLHFDTYKYDYHKHGSVRLNVNEDQFINRTVTQRRIQTSSGGSGGSHHSSSSHRSSTHHSSSGRSHGGSGRKF